MPIRSIKTISTTSAIGMWEITESSVELEKMVKLSGEDLSPLHLLPKEKRKQEWLASRALIREMLGISPIIFHDKNRKPHLKNAEHFLSVSHSGAYACVYLHDTQPVGVDIQQMKPSILKGVDYFLKKEEQDWLDLHDNTLLHLIWSAKESVFKLAGDADLDLKKHLTIKPFARNQNGIFEVSILKSEATRCVQIGYETFDDYVLTWTC